MPLPDMDKTYKIRDPVHGSVKPDAREMDTVDSGYFQSISVSAIYRRGVAKGFASILYQGGSFH